MRAIGYVRVSTDHQAEHGNGLHIQRKAIRDWCKANGHRLVDIHEDAGVSGSNGVDNREGLPLALNAIHKGDAGALVVLRLDRLARALTVQEAALAHIWRDGGRVFATESGEILPDDPDDPMRTAMRQMAGVFAELEKRMLVKRLTDGRRANRDAGKFAAFGSPVYGKRSAGRGVLVDDDREQVGLDRIRQLHAAGTSLRGMVEVLEAEGHAPKRGGRWHPQTLARVVARL